MPVHCRPVAVLLVLTLAVVASAPRPARAQAAATPPNPMVEARAAAVEAEIGRLMQRRGETGASALPLLELRIDVRLVARWLLERAGAGATAAPADADVQACAWIRAADLMAAVKLAEEAIDPAAADSERVALAGKSLHELTFKLADAATVANMDEACRAAATALAAAADPALLDAEHPPMRPAFIPAPAGAAGPAAPGSRTLDQLAARARELAVSVGLRRQLLAVSQAARAAAGDPGRAADAALLRGVFEEAVILAEGLQSNTAVGREDRVKMESQLAEGLALSLDVRTRAMGQKRVAGLGSYRQLLAKVEGMRMSPELLKRFGPALTWARQNPEGPGTELLATIEQFFQQDARLAALKLDAASAGGGNYAKAARYARELATRARGTFIDAAAVATHYKKPEALRRQVETMRRSMDALETIGALPEATRAINALKPRPFGGIDKRVGAALAAWGPDGTDATRESGTTFLATLVRLAGHARELNGPGPGAGDEAARRYTGEGGLGEFRARRKAVVAEIANATAAGQAFELATLARLETARSLASALQLATDAERAVARADVLRRWVDWGVSRESLDALLEPYRAATAAAFDAFADGPPAAVEQWAAARARYEPVLALLARTGRYADACGGLPVKLPGAIAKLMTPLADGTFAAERAARFSVDHWAYFHRRKDEKSAAVVLDALSARLPK